MPALDIKNLHVYYGHIHALKGIDLHVEEGEIVTLIGSNGAGKTTTLRAISGLLKTPEDTSIKYNDVELTQLRAHQTVERGVVHVPEGRRVFSRMSVQENLSMGAYRLNLSGLRQSQRASIWIARFFVLLFKRSAPPCHKTRLTCLHRWTPFRAATLARLASTWRACWKCWMCTPSTN